MTSVYNKQMNSSHLHEAVILKFEPNMDISQDRRKPKYKTESPKSDSHPWCKTKQKNTHRIVKFV